MLGAAIVGASVCHRVALLFVHVSFAHTVRRRSRSLCCASRAARLAPRLNARAQLELLAILGVGLSARTEFAFDWRGLLAAASALAIAVGSVGQKRALLAAPPGRDGGGAGGADAGAGASAVDAGRVLPDERVRHAAAAAVLALFGARAADRRRGIARARRAQRARDGRAARVSLSVLARMSPVSHSLVSMAWRVVVFERVDRRLPPPCSRRSARPATRASAGVACYSHRGARRCGARADDEAALLEREDAGGAAV